MSYLGALGMSPVWWCLFLLADPWECSSLQFCHNLCDKSACSWGHWISECLCCSSSAQPRHNKCFRQCLLRQRITVACENESSVMNKTANVSSGTAENLSQTQSSYLESTFWMFTLYYIQVISYKNIWKHMKLVKSKYTESVWH